MLLAYVQFESDEGAYSDLCVVPEKEDLYSKPFRVRLLSPQTAAVYRIGPKEALTVCDGPEPNSIVLTSVLPAILYLTPDSAEQPGMKVHRAMIIPCSDGYRTFYQPSSTDVQWREWVANKLRAS